jgi:DNA-binding XRE family transcriptional regulator
MIDHGQWSDRVTGNIAVSIQRMMEKADVSGVELAQKTGFPVMTVNDCINGRKVPRVSLVLAIARVLDTSVEALAKGPKDLGRPRRVKVLQKSS